jgi:hypothetical protein
MGSPLFPVLADLYMEKMETNIKVQDTGNHIKFWKRYVDDIFALISREGDPEAILAQANSISDTVKFMLENEREGSLAFLDVKITKSKSKLVTPVYRNSTDSGRYLHYKSNHPRSVKVGVAACLLKNAESHCGTEKAQKEERKTVITTLKKNGYPHTVFNELPRKENRKKMETRNE